MVKENKAQGGGLVPVTVGEDHVPERGNNTTAVGDMRYGQLRPFTFLCCSLRLSHPVTYRPLNLKGTQIVRSVLFGSEID